MNKQFDASAVAAAVLTCSSVESLHGGRFGEVVTYSPKGRVRGVRLRDGIVEVHVVATPSATEARVIREVRAALRATPSALAVVVERAPLPTPQLVVLDEASVDLTEAEVAR